MKSAIKCKCLEEIAQMQRTHEEHIKNLKFARTENPAIPGTVQRPQYSTKHGALYDAVNSIIKYLAYEKESNKF